MPYRSGSIETSYMNPQSMISYLLFYMSVSIILNNNPFFLEGKNIFVRKTEQTLRIPKTHHVDAILDAMLTLSAHCNPIKYVHPLTAYLQK